MSASQNETDTTKCNKYSNIPKEKLKYEYQDLIYFIEKSCGVYWQKAMYNIILVYSFILDTSDSEDGIGSGVDCKL